MNASVLAFLGITGGILNTAGLIPYIRDIFLKKTKPERATWWIWSALNTIAFIALIDAGPTWGLATFGMQLLATILVAFLSIKYGFGSFRRRDVVSLIFAFFGIVLWQMTEQPVAALLILIGIDVTALWLTLSKTWKAPHSETLSTWILTLFGCIFGLLAVGSLEFTKVIFQFYIVIGSVLIVGIILYRRPRVKIQEENDARKN